MAATRNQYVNIDMMTVKNDTLGDFLNNLYDDVMRYDMSIVDSMYLSSEFLALQKEIDKSSTNRNHWVQNRFDKNTSFNICNFKRITNDIGYVEVNVKNGENESNVILELIRENGKWKVNDFIYDFYSDIARIRLELNIPTPLKENLKDYMVMYTAKDTVYNDIECTLGSISIMKYGKNKSKITFIDEYKSSLSGIKETQNGFNVYMFYGHNKYYYGDILKFEYENNDFYLKRIVQYDSKEDEDGMVFEEKEIKLKTPILFEKVSINKCLYRDLQ